MRRLTPKKKKFLFAALSTLAIAILTLVLAFGVNWTPASNGSDQTGTSANTEINNDNKFATQVSDAATFLSTVYNTISTDVQLTTDITISESDLSTYGVTASKTNFWENGIISSGVTFDGGGHTITITSSTSYESPNDETPKYSGVLFGKNSGTIRNLNLVIDINLTSYGVYALGGLVGYNTGTIDNCTVTINSGKTLRGQWGASGDGDKDTCTGGMVGLNSGTITNSTVNILGTVAAYGSANKICVAVGGVVGSWISGTMDNVSIKGNGTIHRGTADGAPYGASAGFVGYMRRTTYSGNNGNTYSGHTFVTLNYLFTGTYSYDSGSEQFIGAIVGDANSVSISITTIGYKNSELTLGSTGNITGSGSLAYTDSRAKNIAGRATGFSVSSQTVYREKIATAEKLIEVLGSSTALSENYLLTNDITLTAAQVASIGGAVLSSGFTFDGGGHSITLEEGTATLKTATDTYAYSGGLFAINNGTIKNVNLYINTKLSCSAVALGGLVGINKGTITDCSVNIGSAAELHVTSARDGGVGGLIGINDAPSSTVSGCDVTLDGKIWLSNPYNAHGGMGGIAGWNIDGTLTDVSISGSGVIKSDASDNSTYSWKFYGGVVGGNRGGYGSSSNSLYAGIVMGTTSYGSIEYNFTGTFECGASTGEIYVGKIIGFTGTSISGVPLTVYGTSQISTSAGGNKQGSSSLTLDQSTLTAIGNGSFSATQTVIEPPEKYATPSAMDYGNVRGGYTPTGTAINSLASLKAFLSSSTGTGYLTQDITITTGAATLYNGTFADGKTLDGNGYSIIFSGQYSANNGQNRNSGSAQSSGGVYYDGMLVAKNEGVIKNLKLVIQATQRYNISSSTSSASFGIVVGDNAGAIENVSVIVEDGKTYYWQANSPSAAPQVNFGMIAGNNTGTISYVGAYIGDGAIVSHKGQTGTGTSNTGGLVGLNSGTVEYCSIYGGGTLKDESSNSSATVSVGGIVGRSTGTVQYCYYGLYTSPTCSNADYLALITGYTESGTISNVGRYNSSEAFTNGATASYRYKVTNSQSSVKARGFFDYFSQDNILLLEFDKPEQISSISTSVTDFSAESVGNSTIGDNVAVAYSSDSKQVYVYTTKFSDSNTIYNVTVTPSLNTTYVDALDIINAGYTDTTTVSGTKITSSTAFPLSGSGNYYLDSDITISAGNVTYTQTAFSGTLYGNGHTITFTAGVINVTGKDYTHFGLLTAALNGTIQDLNVVIDGAVVFGTTGAQDMFVGAYTGIVNTGTIRNCSLTINSGAEFKLAYSAGNTTSKWTSLGGFVGRTAESGTMTLENLYFNNSGTIRSTPTSDVNGSDGGNGYVKNITSGIVGYLQNNSYSIQKLFITGSGTIKSSNFSEKWVSVITSFRRVFSNTGDYCSGKTIPYVYLQNYQMTLTADTAAGLFIAWSGDYGSNFITIYNGYNNNDSFKGYKAHNNINASPTLSSYYTNTGVVLTRDKNGAYVNSLTIDGQSVTGNNRSQYIKEKVNLPSNGGANHVTALRYSDKGTDRHAIYSYSQSGTSITYTSKTSNMYSVTTTLDDSSSYALSPADNGVKKIFQKYAYAVNSRSTLGITNEQIAKAYFGFKGKGGVVLGNGSATASGTGTDAEVGYNIYGDSSIVKLLVLLPNSLTISDVHSTYGTASTESGSYDSYYNVTSGSNGTYLPGVKYKVNTTDTTFVDAVNAYSPSYQNLSSKGNAYSVYISATSYTIYNKDSNKYITYSIINGTTSLGSSEYSAYIFKYEGTTSESIIQGAQGYIHQYKLDGAVWKIDNVSTDSVVYNGSTHNVTVDFTTKVGTPSPTYATTPEENKNVGAYTTTATLAENGNYALGEDASGAGIYSISKTWNITPAPVTLTLTKSSDFSKIYDGSTSSSVTLSEVAANYHDSSKTSAGQSTASAAYAYTGAFSTTVSGLNMTGRLSYSEPTTFAVGNPTSVGTYDLEISYTSSTSLMVDGSDSVSNFTLQSVEYSGEKATYTVNSVLIKTAVSDIEGEKNREYTAAKQYFASASLAEFDMDSALSTQCTAYGKTFDDIKTALISEINESLDVAYIYVGKGNTNGYTFINAQGADATSDSGAGFGAITTGGAVNVGQYRYFGYSLSGNFKVNVDILGQNTSSTALGSAYATVYNGYTTAFKVTHSTWSSLGAIFGFDLSGYGQNDNDRYAKLQQLIDASSVAEYNSAVKGSTSGSDDTHVYITKASVSIVAKDQAVEYGKNLLDVNTLIKDAYNISSLPDAMSKDVFKQSLIDNGFGWEMNSELSSYAKSYTKDGVLVKYLPVKYGSDGNITAWRNAIAPIEYVDYNLDITYVYGNLTVYQKELKIEWYYNGSDKATSIGSSYADSAYNSDLNAYVYDGNPHKMTLAKATNLEPGDEAVSILVSHTGDNAVTGTDVGTYTGFYVYFDPSQSTSAYKNYYLGEGTTGSFRIVPKDTTDVFTVDSVRFNNTLSSYSSYDSWPTFASMVSGTSSQVAVILNISSAYTSYVNDNWTAFQSAIKSASTFTYASSPSGETSVTGSAWTVTKEGSKIYLVASVTYTANRNDGREAAYNYVLASFYVDGQNYNTNLAGKDGWVEVKASSYSVARGTDWKMIRSITTNYGSKDDGNDVSDNCASDWGNVPTRSKTDSTATGVAVVNSSSRTYSFTTLASYASWGEAIQQVQTNYMNSRQYKTENGKGLIEYYRASNNSGSDFNLYTGLNWFDVTVDNEADAEALKNGSKYISMSSVFKTYGEWVSGTWFFGPACLSVLVYGLDDAYAQDGITGTATLERYKYIDSYVGNMGLSSSQYKTWKYTPNGYGSWTKYEYYGQTSAGEILTTAGITGYSSFRFVFMVSAGDKPAAWSHSCVHAKITDTSVTLKDGTAVGEGTRSTVSSADKLSLDATSGNQIYLGSSHRLADGNFRFTVSSTDKSYLDYTKVSVIMSSSTAYNADKTLSVGNGLRVVGQSSADNTTNNFYYPYSTTFETQLDRYQIEKYYLSGITYTDGSVTKTWNGSWVRHDSTEYGTDLTSPSIYITAVEGVNYSKNDQQSATASLYGGWVEEGKKLIQVTASEYYQLAGWSNGTNKIYISGLKSFEMSTSPEFPSASTKTVSNSSQSSAQDLSLTFYVEAKKEYYLRATDFAGNSVIKAVYFETNDTRSSMNLEIAVYPQENGTTVEAFENVWTNKDIKMLLSGSGEGNSLARLYYRRIYNSRKPSLEVESISTTFTSISTWDGLKTWLTMAATEEDTYKYAKLTGNITVPADADTTILSLNKNRVLEGDGKTLTISNTSTIRTTTLNTILNAMSNTDVSSRFLYENNGTIRNLKVVVDGCTETLSQNAVYSPFVAINNGTLYAVTMTLTDAVTTARNGYEYTAVVGGMTAINRGYIGGSTLTVNTLTVSPATGSNGNAVLGGLSAVNEYGEIKGNTATVTGTASVNVASGYESYGGLLSALVNYSVTNFDLISSLNIVVKGNAYTHNPITENSVGENYVTATVGGQSSTSAHSDRGSLEGVGVAAIFTGEDVNYGWIALQAKEDGNYIKIDDSRQWLFTNSGVYSLEIMFESGTGSQAYVVYDSSGNLYYNSFADGQDNVTSREVETEQQNTHDSSSTYTLSGGQYVNALSNSTKGYYTVSNEALAGSYIVSYYGVGDTNATVSYRVNSNNQTVTRTSDGVAVGTVKSTGYNVTEFYVDSDKYIVNFNTGNFGSEIKVVKENGEYESPVASGYFNLKIDKRNYLVAFETVVDIDDKGVVTDSSEIANYISYTLTKNDGTDTAIVAATDSTEPGDSAHYSYYTLPASSENDPTTWTAIKMDTVKNSDIWYGISAIETYKVTNGKIDKTVVLSNFNGTEWDMQEVGTGNVATTWSRLASVNVPQAEEDVDEMEQNYKMVIRVHIKYYARVSIDVQGTLSHVYGEQPSSTTFNVNVSSGSVVGTTKDTLIQDNTSASFYALDLTGEGIYYNPTTYAVYGYDAANGKYYTKQVLAAKGIRDTEFYSIDLYNADPSLMVNMLTPVGDHHLVLKEIGMAEVAKNYIVNFDIKDFYTVEKRPVYVNIADNFGKLYDGKYTWDATTNRTGARSVSEPNVLSSYDIKTSKYRYGESDTTTYEIGGLNTGKFMNIVIDGTEVHDKYVNIATLATIDRGIVGAYDSTTSTFTAYGRKYTIKNSAVYDSDGDQVGSMTNSSQYSIYTAPVTIDYAYFTLDTGATESRNVGAKLKLFLSDKSNYMFGTLSANDGNYTVDSSVPSKTGDGRKVDTLEKVGDYVKEGDKYKLTFSFKYQEFTAYLDSFSQGASIFNDKNEIIGEIDNNGSLQFAGNFVPETIKGETFEVVADTASDGSTLSTGIVYHTAQNWSAALLGETYAKIYKKGIYVRAGGTSTGSTTTTSVFNGTAHLDSATTGMSEETDSDNILGKAVDKNGNTISTLLPFYGHETGETISISNGKADGSATDKKVILAGTYEINYNPSNLTVDDVNIWQVETPGGVAINTASNEANYYIEGVIRNTSATTYQITQTITEATNMLYVNRVIGDDGKYRILITVSGLTKSYSGLDFLNANADFVIDGADLFEGFINAIGTDGYYDMTLETAANQTKYNNMQSYFAKANGDTTTTEYQQGLAIQKELSSSISYLLQKALGRIFRYAVNGTKSFATVTVAYNKDSFAGFHFDSLNGKLTFEYLGDSAKESAYLADRYSVKIAGAVEAITDNPGAEIDETKVSNSSNISMTTSSLSDGQVTLKEYESGANASYTEISTVEELKTWLQLSAPADTTSAEYTKYAHAYLTGNILGFDWEQQGTIGGSSVGLDSGRTLDGRGYAIELSGNQVASTGATLAMSRTKMTLKTTIQKSTYNASGVFLQYIKEGAQLKNINFVYTGNRYYVETGDSQESGSIANDGTGRAIGIVAGIVQTTATTETSAPLYNIALEIRGKFGYKGTDSGTSAVNDSVYAVGGLVGIIDGSDTSYHGMVSSTIYYYSSPTVSNIEWSSGYDIYVESAAGTTVQNQHVLFGALVGALSKVTLKNVSTRTEKMTDSDENVNILIKKTGGKGWMFCGGGIGLSRSGYSGVVNGYINKFKGKITISNAGGEAYLGAISGNTYNNSGSCSFSNVYSYYSNYGTAGLNLFTITGGISSSMTNLSVNNCLTGNSSQTIPTIATDDLTVGRDGSSSSGYGLIDYYFGSNNYGATVPTDTSSAIDYYYNTIFINDKSVVFDPFANIAGWTAGTNIYDSYLRKEENKVGTLSSSFTVAVGSTFTVNDTTYTITKVEGAEVTATSGADSAETRFTFDTAKFTFVNTSSNTKYYYGVPSVSDSMKTEDASSINIEVLAPNGYFVWDYHLANYTNTLTDQGAVTRLVWSTEIGHNFGDSITTTDGKMSGTYYDTSASSGDGSDETVYYYAGYDSTNNEWWTKNWHNAVLGTYVISASDAPSTEVTYEYTGEVVKDPISITIHVSYVNKNTNQLVDKYTEATVQMTEEMVNVGSYVVSEFDGVDFDDTASGGKTNIKSLTRALTGSSSGNQVMIVVVPKTISMVDGTAFTKTYDNTTKYVVQKSDLTGFVEKDQDTPISLSLKYNDRDVLDATYLSADDNNTRKVLVDKDGNYISFVKDTSYTKNFTSTGLASTYTNGYKLIEGGEYSYYLKENAPNVNTSLEETTDTTYSAVYDEFAKVVGYFDATTNNVYIKQRYKLNTINYTGTYEGTADKFNLADDIPRPTGWLSQTAAEKAQLKLFYYAYMQATPVDNLMGSPFYNSISGSSVSSSDGSTYSVVEVVNLYMYIPERENAVYFYVTPTLTDDGNGVIARNYALLAENYYINPMIVKNKQLTIDGSNLKVGNIAVATDYSSTQVTIDGLTYSLDGTKASEKVLFVADVQQMSNYAEGNVFGIKVGESTYYGNGGKVYLTSELATSNQEANAVATYDKKSGNNVLFTNGDTLTYNGVTYTIINTPTNADVADGYYRITGGADSYFDFKVEGSTLTVTDSVKTGGAIKQSSATKTQNANFAVTATITAREVDILYTNLIREKTSTDQEIKATLSYIEDETLSTEMTKNGLTEEEIADVKALKWTDETVTPNVKAALDLSLTWDKTVEDTPTKVTTQLTSTNFKIKVNTIENAGSIEEKEAYLGQDTLTSAPLSLVSTLKGEKLADDKDIFLLVEDTADFSFLVNKGTLAAASIRLKADIDATDIYDSIIWGNREDAIFDGGGHVITNYSPDNAVFMDVSQAINLGTVGIKGTIKNIKFFATETFGGTITLAEGATAENVVFQGTDLSGTALEDLSASGIYYEMTYSNDADGTQCYIGNYIATLTDAEKIDFINTYILNNTSLVATADALGTQDKPILVTNRMGLADAVSIAGLYFKVANNITLHSDNDITNYYDSGRCTISLNGKTVTKSDGTTVVADGKLFVA